MPKYIVEYWQLHVAEVETTDGIEDAKKAAEDFMRDAKSTDTVMRLHKITEANRAFAADHVCPWCEEEKDEQTGPWVKGKIFVPPPKEKQ